MSAWGCLHTETDSRDKRITICVAHHNYGRVGQGFQLYTYTRTLEELLGVLAHELAHLVHWEHTDKHLELTAKILAVFARNLKKAVLPNDEIKTAKTRRMSGSALR